MLFRSQMAVGFNATWARHGSFLDKLYVPGLNQQAIDRLHRIGQQKSQPVQIREYICMNTYENRIEAINVSKAMNIDQTIQSDNNKWKKELVAAMKRA